MTFQKNNYNDDPVEYCAYCKSLHILETKNGVICGSCGAENYTNTHKNIEEYLERFGKR